MEERFLYCPRCGNLAFLAIASGIIPHCCGAQMLKLTPNTTDGSTEKHLPVVQVIGNKTLKVRIGSEPHPMSPEHNIRFVCLETDIGGVIRYLCPEQEPEVTIRYKGTPIAVYAYCNLHGLWRTDIKKIEYE